MITLIIPVDWTIWKQYFHKWKLNCLCINYLLILSTFLRAIDSWRANLCVWASTYQIPEPPTLWYILLGKFSLSEQLLRATNSYLFEYCVWATTYQIPEPPTLEYILLSIFSLLGYFSKSHRLLKGLIARPFWVLIYSRATDSRIRFADNFHSYFLWETYTTWYKRHPSSQYWSRYSGVLNPVNFSWTRILSDCESLDS